jgi:hypothetical protein
MQLLAELAPAVQKRAEIMSMNKLPSGEVVGDKLMALY